MTLPDFVLPTRANTQWAYSGIDSPELCLDPKHFATYPHSIQYKFNSRGYRDAEWPETSDELQRAIWCVGDSFTVGVGCPVTHTWPGVLQQRTGQRSINVSMDGASNNWIARQLTRIITQIQPATAVVQWSYLERREDYSNSLLNRNWQEFYCQVQAPDWPPVPAIENFAELPQHIQLELLTKHDQSWRQGVSDEQLRLGHVRSTDQADVQNTQDLIHWTESLANQHGVKLIHSFIPQFATVRIRNNFFTHLKTQHCIGEIPQLDWARDHHHYDCKTSQWIVQQLMQLLQLPGAVPVV